MSAAIAFLVFVAVWAGAFEVSAAAPAARRRWACALAVLTAGVAAGHALIAVPAAALWVGAGPLIARRSAARRARWAEWRDAPDFADALALNLNAGLPFDRAWHAAVDGAGPGRFRDAAAAAEASAGRTGSWPSALTAFSDAAHAPAVQSLFRLLAAHLKAGAAVEAALSESAAHLRSTYLLELERRAQALSVRLLVPIVFLILPAVFLLLFGPVLLEVRAGRLW